MIPPSGRSCSSSISGERGPAAALLHSLVLNHPFLGGNERVGAHAAVLFLLVNGTGLKAVPAALADITLATARGEMSAEALSIWFGLRLRPLEP